jgi:hypothetical protein
MVDRSLLAHWEREQRSRRRARASLPPSWRSDPRPEMARVRELFVEGIADMTRAAQPARGDR